MVKTEIRLIIFFATEDVKVLQSAKTRPEVDCSCNHEFLFAKFRLELKKVGKIIRPFRYDLLVPYDYTVEIANRFKGLDLIECLEIYGWKFITWYRKQ